jgi:hypothetical protein
MQKVEWHLLWSKCCYSKYFVLSLDILHVIFGKTKICHSYKKVLFRFLIKGSIKSSKILWICLKVCSLFCLNGKAVVKVKISSIFERALAQSLFTPIYVLRKSFFFHLKNVLFLVQATHISPFLSQILQRLQSVTFRA